MNVLINNLTGVTSTSAGQHRLDGRPVGAHDELDHHGIGWRVGPSAVRPGPGDPFTWSVERHPGLDQPADGPQNRCRDRTGKRPPERVAPFADTLKALKTC